MSDNEMLKLILEKVTGIENDVTELKSDVAELKSDVAELKSDVDKLKCDVSELQSEVSVLRRDVDRLQSNYANMDESLREVKIQQTETRVILENITEKTFQLLHEGYQMNFEKIDRLNIDSVNSKLNVLEAHVYANTQHIELLRKRIAG